MNRQSLSRSERRMERKQVLLLLVVVIGVGLGCFALGVMVGRSAAPVAPAAPRIPVAAAPAGAPTAAPSPPAPATAAQAPAAAPDGTGKPADLTFYDNLPRGEEPPLGSGINLPPGTQERKPTPAPAVPSAPAATPAAPAPHSASPVVSSPAAKPAATAAAGSYVVQVASFSRPDDAGVLQARLAKKGFEAFVQQADLGSKGTWYRVFVGPLSSSAAAEQVAARLKAQEKLAPLVRKR